MRIFLIILFVTIVVLDQITKALALEYLTLGMPVEVIPGFFNFTLVFNPGAAFGIFSDLPDFYRRTLLIVVTLIAFVIIYKLLRHEVQGKPVLEAALVGVLAGALGNLIDRIRFDAVVDFFDFYVGHYHWPAFNIADSAISVGVVIVLIGMLFEKKPEK